MERNNDFSEAFRKIREDCRLYGMSKNYLAELLIKDDRDNQTTEGDAVTGSKS